MLLEQEEVTMALKKQQSGRSSVDANDTVKAVSRSGQVTKELYDVRWLAVTRMIIRYYIA